MFVRSIKNTAVAAAAIMVLNSPVYAQTFDISSVVTACSSGNCQVGIDALLAAGLTPEQLAEQLALLSAQLISAANTNPTLRSIVASSLSVVASNSPNQAQSVAIQAVAVQMADESIDLASIDVTAAVAGSPAG